jgi:serine/threonine-protein kinase
MGVVVAARHEQLGFPVALKFMLPAALQDAQMKDRFLREARAAGRLRGEHVARVMDFGTLDDGAPYIVMEFLEGKDLEALIAERGRLPEAEAIEYVLQACKAMQEAHDQGIVHRDLKPQNLFLTHRPDGTPLVKVLDFGISKLIEKDAQSMSMTASAAIIGSPAYMAPEQLRSSKNVDHRADIYSLGVILYQLVSGTLPVQASSLGELFELVFIKTIPPLRERCPDVSPPLDALVMRCLEKEPAARFASIAELVDGLRGLTGSAGALGLPATGGGAGRTAVPAQTMVFDPKASPQSAPAQAATGSSAGPITTLGNASAASSFPQGGPQASGASKRGLFVGLGVGAALAAAVGVGMALRGAGAGSTSPERRPASSADVMGVALPPVAAPSASAPPAISVAAEPSATPAASLAPEASAKPLASAAGIAPVASAAPSSASRPTPQPRPAKPAAPATAKPASKPASADPFGSPD